MITLAGGKRVEEDFAEEEEEDEDDSEQDETEIDMVYQ